MNLYILCNIVPQTFTLAAAIPYRLQQQDFE
uniref:Uncharacterized protein n=1 Tax=Arundo donax TaxID=35708 RepID=A0A0A9D0Q4_ARUDO